MGEMGRTTGGATTGLMGAAVAAAAARVGATPINVTGSSVAGVRPGGACCRRGGRLLAGDGDRRWIDLTRVGTGAAGVNRRGISAVPAGAAAADCAAPATVGGVTGDDPGHRCRGKEGDRRGIVRRSGVRAETHPDATVPFAWSRPADTRWVAGAWAAHGCPADAGAAIEDQA